MKVETNNLLEQIFEQSHDALCITDLSKKIIKANSRFAALFGISPSDAVGKSLGRRYFIDGDFFKKALEASKNNSPLPSKFSQMIDKQGNEKVLYIIPSPIYNADNTLEKICFNYRDTTDLYASRRKLQFQDMLFKDLQDAVIATGLDGSLIYWNKAAECMFGFTEQEIMGKKLFELGIFDDSAKFKSIDSNFSTSAHLQDTFSYENKLGCIVSIEANLAIVKSEVGEAIGYLIVCRDINEKIEQSNRLLNSELEKSNILDSQTDLIVLQDTEHNIIWANKASLDNANMSLSEIKGKKCYEIWGNSEGICEGCIVHQVKKTHKAVEFERQMDIGQIWQIKASPIFDKDGNLLRILEVAEDITVKKYTEKRVAENEAQYRNLVNSAPIGIVVFQKFSPVFANAKAMEIIGFDNLDDFLKTNIFSYIHNDDIGYLENIIASLRNSTAMDNVFNANIRIIVNDNEIRHISATISRFQISDERYYQAILMDNTELVELNAVQKNLAVESVYLNEKNKFIEELSKKFKYLSEKYNFDDGDKRKYEKTFRTYFQPERDWVVSKKHFEAVHKDFFTNLKKAYPNITQNELRHCAYIRMNYTTKEIARIFNVEASSVQKARLRLKKKMKLERDDDLFMFIMSV